jgi:PAS domain S-box-containing protein
MGIPLRVLLIEDSEDDALLLGRELVRAGYEPTVTRVQTAEALSRALDEQEWDVVLADWALPHFNAPAALATLKDSDLDLPFIIVSGTIGEEPAVAAMKAGAHDYVMKSDLARLVPAVEREVHEAAERRRRRQVEEALVREQDFSRALVEGANALVVGLDPEGRVTMFNRAAEQITGYPREAIRGRQWFELVVPRQRYPYAWEMFTALISAGASADFEHPMLTAAGDERIVSWRNSVLREGATVLGVISFGIDITDRKQVEAERAALEGAARRAEKLAAIGTLAAGLAHELNNPIGIISSRIEIMLMEAESRSLPTGLLDDLRVLHRHALRIAKIARGLLSFSRPGPGQPGPVDLNQVVEETLLLTEKQVTRAGITIRLALASGLPPLRGDADTLQQVMLNLVANAADAIGGVGEIRIETSLVPDRPGAVRLAVSDTGAGIAPEAMPRLFEPFFTTKAKGTGLGLAITYGIVREHRGTIDVESTPGVGTRFVLTFPVLSSEDAT